MSNYVIVTKRMEHFKNEDVFVVWSDRWKVVFAKLSLLGRNDIDAFEWLSGGKELFLGFND